MRPQLETEDPCTCLECRVAGVSERPPVYSRPGVQLHGRDVALWYERKRQFDEALERFKAQRGGRERA